MDSSEYLISPMLQGFVWMDEGLQNYLRGMGWPEVTRPQSMVMANVVSGVTKPSDIARNLGVSRQAAHVTIRQMIDLGMIKLVPDPEDRRAKIVAISETGSQMRVCAQEGMLYVSARLRERIGARKMEQLKEILAADWGEPPVAPQD